MAELNSDASDLEKEFLAMEVEHEGENELDRLKKKIHG
jgi:hypothetical protein